jgi:hypothetical protein
MGLRTGVRSALIAAAIALVGLVGVSPAFAQAGFTRGTPVVLPAPTGAAAGAAGLQAVGCSTAGNCSAVGVYNGGSTENPVFIGLSDDEVGGVWQASGSFALPDAGSVTFDNWVGVACTSPGNCLAIGNGDVLPSGHSVGIQASETDGAWGSATTIAMPGDAYQGDEGSEVQGLACASASSCVAVGGYTSTTIGPGDTDESDAMAATGSIAGVGGFAGVQDNADLWSVACAPGASSCTAVGYEQQNYVDLAEAVTDSGGSWGTPTVITPNPGLYGAYMQAVACPQVNLCTAVGEFNPTNGGYTPSVFTVKQAADGSWSSPATLGFSVADDGSIYPYSVSCVDTTDCTVAGVMDPSSISYSAGFYADETGGTWGQAALMPLPAGASAASGGGADRVSCGGNQCVAAGEAEFPNVGTEPYEVTASINQPPSATVVACTQLTDGTTNYSCTAKVSDGSGQLTPTAPTGTVSLSSTLGTFPNGSSCTLVGDGTVGEAACSLNFDPGAGYGNQVTITGSYPGGGTFSASQGQTTFTPQCNQDPTETDGAWQIGGCFTNPDTTDDDTEQTSTLDGMTVTPSSSSDQVDFSTGGPSGQSVSSSAATSLALNVGSLSGGSQSLITLTSKLANLDLSGGPVTIPLPSGFNLLGLPLSGSITFKPQAGGSAVGTATGTLPGVLGGGTATVTVTTSASGQVTSVAASATSGSLVNVFGLSTLKLNYKGSTWTVNATAQGANNTTQQMNGTLSFDSSGHVTAGNLAISNVVIAGLLQVKTFTLAYSATTGWGGTADLAQGSQIANVSITVNGNGVITSGSIKASGITLWQVFTLKSFAMTYTGGSWGLSLAVEGKKGAPAVSAGLSMSSSGTVLGANLEFKNVSMLGKITVDDLKLVYTHTATQDLFSGSAEVSLPSTAVSKVKGSFQMTDGLLTQATLDADTNIPLYGALVLTHVGAEIDLVPSKKIIGKIDLSAGPKVAGRSLLAMENGAVEYDFPAATGAAGTYIFSGDLTALGKTLGQGKITVDSGIAKLSLTLGSKGAGFKIGKALTANGSITGAIHGKKFTAQGTVSFDAVIRGHRYPASGKLTLSNDGVVACAKIPALSSTGDSGLSIGWDGAITTYNGNCPFA